MLRIYARAIAVFLLIASVVAHAQICPASVVVGPQTLLNADGKTYFTYTTQGIGDGCTTSYQGLNGAVIFPEVGIFRSTFTPSCDRHDKCYTTLGTNGDDCDYQFRSSMLSACDSNYPWWLVPTVYAACQATANEYYAVVSSFRKNNVTHPYPDFQYFALAVSRDLERKVNGDTCGTTPERTTLYSASLIATVNNAFNTYAGRLPTIYEFLKVVNADYYGNNIVNNPTWWNQNLITTAIYAPKIVPVLSGYSMSAKTSFPVFLTVNPILPGVNYSLHINWAISSGTSISVASKEPMYNVLLPVQGFVTAERGGVKNLLVIDTSVLLLGACSPSPRLHCI
jgi:hypothetical protein